MAVHIPFVTSDDGIQLVAKFYHDSDFVRVPLDRADKFVPRIPSGIKLWLDSCTDGMDDLAKRHKPDRKNPWFDCLNSLPNFQKVASASFHAKPVVAEVKAFVNAILDKCAKSKPALITLPQLPVVGDSSRNKLNKMLAEAAGNWKANSDFRGSLILPLIFKHQQQVNGKTARTPKVALAERCYRDSAADGFWVVDADLKDESGSGTLMNKRFPAVIGLHEELNAKISSNVRIAGPYWGLNLLLWAKGLIDYPAIGIGSGFQYFLSGALHGSPPSARLALPPLRRRAVADSSLEKWLASAVAQLSSSHPAHAEFTSIKSHFALLKANSKEQVAQFYKAWFNSIAAVPTAGRSMALFQDLSAAYALGRALPDLSDSVRRPEALAEPLMFKCL
ncbi:MAG: hypothetical protein R3C17_19140 [Planctomycetaceae bacterium]